MSMEEHDRLLGQESKFEPSRGSLADFDEATYRPYLHGLELSDQEASELLRVMWDMMRMCIEMKLPAESWGQITSAIFAAGDGQMLE